MLAHWTDIFIPPIGTLVITLMGWLYFRQLNMWGPLDSFQRALLLYGGVFFFGVLCGLLVIMPLQWPPQYWIPLIIAWGTLVGLFAYFRQKRLCQPRE